MKYEEIRTQATEDLKTDIFDLAHESVRTANIFTKYLDMLRGEKVLLKKLEDEYNKLYKDSYLWYHGEADDEVYEKNPWPKKVNRMDLPMYLNADENIIKMTDRVVLQKEKVAYLERVVKFIENRNYGIKNAIDYLKFTQGN